MSVKFTSAGTSLPIWGVRAGMLIEETRYDHQEQSLWCDVVDKREIVGEIVRGLRETAKLIADRDRAEEVEQAADNVAALFGLTGEYAKIRR